MHFSHCIQPDDDYRRLKMMRRKRRRRRTARSLRSKKSTRMRRRRRSRERTRSRVSCKALVWLASMVASAVMRSLRSTHSVPPLDRPTYSTPVKMEKINVCSHHPAKQKHPNISTTNSPRAQDSSLRLAYRSRSPGDQKSLILRSSG